MMVIVVLVVAVERMVIFLPMVKLVSKVIAVIMVGYCGGGGNT